MARETTKFEYGMAYYSEEGLMDAHPDSMPDISVDRTAVGPFLEEAGQRGWEFCGLLPVNGDGYKYCAIFKRAIQ